MRREFLWKGGKLIRAVVLIVVILFVILSAPAIVAETGVGVIDGQVVNGTDGGGSVADLDLVLTVYQEGAEVDTIEGGTDAEGKFQFDGLPTETDYDYMVSLWFQEAEYSNDSIIFGGGNTTVSTEIIVYDSTTSDEAIFVGMTHTVIYVENGGLLVEEYYLFVNEANTTYIGSKESSPGGKNATLSFSLPEGASNVHLIWGIMDCCYVETEEGFVDTMPILPGTWEGAFSYRIDYDSDAYTFSKTMMYPTATFQLLVEDVGIDVSSSQLVMGEPTDMDGMPLIILSGNNIYPGTPIVAQISGLPKAGDQGISAWVIVVPILLVFAFVLGFLILRKRPQPAVSEDDLDQRMQRLLVDIARLDDDFESGEIAEKAYHRMRSEKKAQLVELNTPSKRRR